MTPLILRLIVVAVLGFVLYRAVRSLAAYGVKPGNGNASGNDDYLARDSTTGGYRRRFMELVRERQTRVQTLMSEPTTGEPRQPVPEVKIGE